MQVARVHSMGRLGIASAAVMSGHEIQRARQLAGLSQRDLADRVGVSKNTVSNWETGKSSPRGKEAILRRELNPDTTTELASPSLRDASHAELLAELARRIEHTERRSAHELPAVPTGRYRFPKTAGPSAQARHANVQEEPGAESAP